MKINDSETIRAKLETWLARFKEAGYPEFHSMLRQFWCFLHKHPVLNTLCETVEATQPPLQHPTWEHALIPLFTPHEKGEMLFFDNEDHHIAYCYQILRASVMEKNANHPQAKIQMEMELARQYHPNPPLAPPDWLYNFYVKNILRPFVQHLQESLDSNKTILAILQRYKHKCEWFQRATLHELWNKADPSKGEWVLKLHLYEYLYDNGVHFMIDPYSPLGKADLVSTQEGSERLIADGKLMKEGTGRKAIIDGFHQVYKYTLDFNDPFGYLIAFNATDKDIGVVSDGMHQGAMYIEHNGRTVYIIIIDINPDPVSASKRGRLRAVAITKEELIAPQEEECPPSGQESGR
jgi:hypothetical protein